MKSYLKLIASVFIALLALSSIATIISGIIMLYTNNYDIRGLTFPFVIAWFGFLLFGIPGTILWLISYIVLGITSWNKEEKQFVSVIIGSIVCVIIYSLVANEFIFSSLFKHLYLLILVIPVAVTGAGVHWYLFIRNKT